jgi:hypothetical protein
MSKNKNFSTSIAYRPVKINAKVRPAKSGLKIIDGQAFERRMAEYERQGKKAVVVE